MKDSSFEENSQKSNFWSKKKQKSKIVRAESELSGQKFNELFQGIVVSNLGNFFEIRKIDDALAVLKEEIYLCKISGTVVSENQVSNRDGSILVVGDKVSFSPVSENEDGNEGIVRQIHLRSRILSRQAAGKKKKEQILAANVAKVIIFVAAESPAYNKRLIDRYLLVAEQNLLEAVIVVNKVDLFPKHLFEDDLQVYKKLGIKIFYISTVEKEKFSEEINKLKAFVLNQENPGFAMLTGPSGVGKSSFLNLFFDKKVQNVNEISERTNKGVHTTSSSKLFLFDVNNGIIDSPGIREFGLWQFEKADIRLYFHDFDEYARDCKYFNCLHQNEPGCAVVDAVEKGLIEADRYYSYLSILSTNPEELY